MKIVCKIVGNVTVLLCRHMWDAFVVPSGVPGSSRIPDGWVEAGEPSSAAWEQYLSTDRTKSVKGGIKT